jgi:hypothetical protein
MNLDVGNVSMLLGSNTNLDTISDLSLLHITHYLNQIHQVDFL